MWYHVATADAQGVLWVTNNDGLARLRQLVLDRAVSFGDVQLSSGQSSSFYIDGKQVTLSADGALLFAEHFLATNSPETYDAVGGPTLGADPMAAAVSVLSQQQGAPKPAFIVRKAAKGHGKMRRIEGPLASEARVIVVEDVVTSGKSVLEAIDALEAEKNCRIVKIVCLVDREQGAKAAFAERGYVFKPIFTASELGIAAKG